MVGTAPLGGTGALAARVTVATAVVLVVMAVEVSCILGERSRPVIRLTSTLPCVTGGDGGHGKDGTHATSGTNSGSVYVTLTPSTSNSAAAPTNSTAEPDTILISSRAMAGTSLGPLQEAGPEQTQSMSLVAQRGSLLVAANGGWGGRGGDGGHGGAGGDGG